MKVLGFDTSTDTITMAVVEDEGIVGELSVRGPGGPVERLAWLLERFLGDLGRTIQDIDGFAVGAGPGSWTGTRVGIVTAKVLAFAGGKPIVGVSSFDALVEGSGVQQGNVFVISDFGKERIFLGTYEVSSGGYNRVGDYQVVGIGELASHVHKGGTVIGKGVVKHGDTLAGIAGVSVLPQAVFPAARHIAMIGLRTLSAGRGDDPSALTPIYVTPSQAEVVARSQSSSGQ